ncbi:hypothetical protein B0A49_13883, partial [Cryomyces minteri]
YTATGETPLKAVYTYPTALPRTDDHGRILSRLRGEEITRSPAKGRSSPSKASPSKAMVFTDAPVSIPSLALSGTTEAGLKTPVDPVRPVSSASNGLKEIDLNILPTTLSIPCPDVPLTTITSGATNGSNSSRDASLAAAPPALKRQNTNTTANLLSASQINSKLPTKRSVRMTVAGGVAGLGEGRENLGAS